MKKLLFLSALLVTACSSDPELPEVTSYEECVTMEGEIKYKEPHQCTIFGETYYENKPTAKFVDYGPATGYYASPVGGGPYPAIILIHEMQGLDRNTWASARKFAQEGYVVLAVDLYDGKKATDPEEATVLSSSVTDDLDGAFDNVKAAVKWVSLQYNVDDTQLKLAGGSFGDEWDARMAENELGVSKLVEQL
ncbi:MAG: dienelactone hydrolase family protein [Candidatus Peribacteraceae bacterium]|mgnify:CR=1 FL=1|jgi:hypothetical protein|nr:hypothetical protein [bacterium]MDP6561445.1 dienelactone hydrolase family protein [Candidatus Peribacteraceae bacterium]|tara:strand:+ start:15382 stop:15960 length:579 start_codon:yes stop_codon:yes gene_type:complete